MKSLNKILLLTLFPVVVCAQPVADTAKIEKQRFKYLPMGIRIGTDVLAIGLSQTNKTFSGWEVNADVDLNRYFLAFDRGAWSREYLSDSVHYSNTGNYYRAGVDVNFLTTDPDRNMFFIGARYGRSSFSETLVLNRLDSVWGPINSSFNSNNIHGRWYELVAGLKVKMWKIFWLGYTARFKFGLKTDEKGDLTPHDVPGYGKTNKESYWGFNYQLMVRIPIRKQPPLEIKKKKK